jgi:hypothetical protein
VAETSVETIFKQRFSITTTQQKSLRHVKRQQKAFDLKLSIFI